MALKKKPPPSGAPEWVLTYGDMMSLLLCFFILLAAFANFEAPGSTTQAMIAIQSIQEALGIKTTNGNALNPAVEMNALVQQIMEAVKRMEQKFKGDSREKGIIGKSVRVRRIRDGMEITIGGPVIFDPLSSQLSAVGKEAVEVIAEELKGHRNKIEIRGHAADDGRPSDWTFHDSMKLAYERSMTVAGELIARGLNPRGLRIEAAGDSEPVAQEIYDPAKRAMNRRVEIFVRESQINDYVGQQPTDLSSASQPAGS